MGDVGTVSRSLGQQIIGKPPRDYNHADDSQYKRLRAQAESEKNQQQKAAARAKKAYSSGNKAEASRLSYEAKQHEARSQDLDGQAAAWVFRANNMDSGPDEIDLHGLFVREALSALDVRLGAGKQRGEQQVKIITGKGIHSENHVAKLRPAIEEYLTKNRIKWHEQHGNAGVVVANLAATPGAGPGPQLYGQPQQFAPSNGNAPGYQNNFYNGGYNTDGGYGGQHQGHGAGQNFNPQKIFYYLRIAKRIMRVFSQCL